MTSAVPRLETVDDTSARMVLPCANHPTGELHVVITTQVAKPGGQLPYKRCRSCRCTFPAVAFIKVTVLRGHYAVLGDTGECYRCDPPSAFELNTDKSGRLRMRLKLTDDTGAPIRVWDQSTRRWRRPAALGLRRMRQGNELRLQPRTARAVDATGRTYKARRRAATNPSLF